MPETTPANLASSSSSSSSSSDRASVKTEEIEAGGVGQEVESKPETAAASSIAVNAFPESSSGIFLSLPSPQAELDGNSLGLKFNPFFYRFGFCVVFRWWWQ